jgi:glycosyltransferase involved in cell wall biosynthesis
LPLDVTHRLASPTKLFEYIHAGLPVIGADVPEIREVLTKCKSGLLVDATSPSEIASAFVRLATDGSLRKTFAENARAAAPSLSWITERDVLVNFVAQRLRDHRSTDNRFLQTR